MLFFCQTLIPRTAGGGTLVPQAVLQMLHWPLIAGLLKHLVLYGHLSITKGFVQLISIDGQLLL